MSYQKFIIVGNLGKDPDLKYTPEGKAVCNMNVAVSEGYGDRKKVHWIRVTTWDKTAENCNQYLQKGSKVLCEGGINSDENGNPRKWENKEGETVCNHEMTAYKVEFLSVVQPAQQEAF